MDTSPPRRGRPATVSADELADLALNLWTQHGYDAVSMGQIAAAAGVNTRTLHRYFPSKSDIIWLTLGSSFDDLADDLAATSAEQSLLTRVRLAILATLRANADTTDNRRRLRIVARTATLQSAASPPFVAWRGVIRDFASHHLDGPAADLSAEIIANAVQSVTMATLTWWAEHGQVPPEQLVDQALRSLESGLGDGLVGDNAP
jgi:AcrR family transcriptional regulator